MYLFNSVFYTGCCHLSENNGVIFFVSFFTCLWPVNSCTIILKYLVSSSIHFVIAIYAAKSPLDEPFACTCSLCREVCFQVMCFISPTRPEGVKYSGHSCYCISVSWHLPILISISYCSSELQSYFVVLDVPMLLFSWITFQIRYSICFKCVLVYLV